MACFENKPQRQFHYRFQLVISTLEKQELNLECLTEGMKSIAYLYIYLCLEDISIELLNRMMNLTFLVTEKVDDEMLAYWCKEIFVELKEDDKFVSFQSLKYFNIFNEF